MVFQRLHDKGEYPGTGIGLAICKKVVDRHGGRVEVATEVGKGTMFSLFLPLHEPGKAPSTGAAAQASRPAPPATAPPAPAARTEPPQTVRSHARPPGA